MKVLVLHSRYLTEHVSGENRVVEDEIELLGRHGHEVISWTPSFEARSSIDAALRAVWSRAATARVATLLARERPDVVHVHNLFPMLSPAVLRTASSVGTPSVMTIQNFRLACLPATLSRGGRICEDCLGRIPWRGVVHSCYRSSRAASSSLAVALSVHRAVGTFDRVTTYAPVSRFLRDKLVQAGVDREAMKVRPNFAWPARIRQGPGSDFLCLGRLVFEKGFDTLVGAWRGPEKLVVVGTGPDEARLRTMARPGVEFHPAVPPGRVEDLLRRARALLLPSRWYEGWPRVAVEAFAVGVPVIASDIGGLPELVDHGQNGLLVPPNAPAAWMDAVSRLTDDAESTRMGSVALEAWQRQYSPEVGLRSLVELYEWTIDRHRGRTSRPTALVE
jgi:glycosyltransferase involved in cell wall biosynthesis